MIFAATGQPIFSDSYLMNLRVFSPRKILDFSLVYAEEQILLAGIFWKHSVTELTVKGIAWETLPSLRLLMGCLAAGYWGRRRAVPSALSQSQSLGEISSAEITPELHWLLEADLDSV